MKLDNVIVALDCDNVIDAKAIVSACSPTITFYKVGLQLFCATQFEVIDWLIAHDYKVMLDLKLQDIPRTIGLAIKELAKRDIKFCTIYTDDEDTIKEAHDNSGDMDIACVTELTSKPVDSLTTITVLSIAMKANAACAAAVVCSGNEVHSVKNMEPSLITIVPGISFSSEVESQSRIVTPGDAVVNGADYLVIGRLITDSDNIADMLVRINRSIEIQKN